MSEPLRVGDVVHGHLDGFFGRDHYDCARVEAIGADWAVIHTFAGTAVAEAGPDIVAALEKGRTPGPYEESHHFNCPAAKD